jgi:hypothetical protein
VDFLHPPGCLCFYEGTTGQVCPSPVPVTYPYFANTLAWMPDGKAFLLSTENQLPGLSEIRFRAGTHGDPAKSSPRGGFLLSFSPAD